jgi:hypothetical protein
MLMVSYALTVVSFKCFMSFLDPSTIGRCFEEVEWEGPSAATRK